MPVAHLLLPCSLFQECPICLIRYHSFIATSRLATSQIWLLASVQVSQVYWVYLLVSLLSKAECHVTIRVAESADVERGGSKVKVPSRLPPRQHRSMRSKSVPFSVPRDAQSKG